MTLHETETVHLREIYAPSGAKRIYPVGTKDSTRTLTTVLALSKLWEAVLTPPDRTLPSKETSYPGKENFVIGLEAALERLLKSEREHD
jgi:hypothetical protein